MSSVTRRGFLRTTSLSVAAVGFLSTAVPGLVRAQEATGSAPQSTPQNAPMPLDSNMAMPIAGGTPFMVYVSDPSSGSGTILVGEQSIPFRDPQIVQKLLQAIG